LGSIETLRLVELDLDPEPATIREREFRVQRILDGLVYEYDGETLARMNDILATKPTPAPPAPKPKPTTFEKVSLPVTLLAKLPYCTNRGRGFVKNEGKIYSMMHERFPWLMEGSKGFIQTKPINQPMAADACVPRFYGMYRHVKYLDDEDVDIASDRASAGDGDVEEQYEFEPETPASWRPKRVSYMLLLEECGVPVVPKSLNSMDK
jgi:hypothetical protein